MASGPYCSYPALQLDFLNQFATDLENCLNFSNDCLSQTQLQKSKSPSEQLHSKEIYTACLQRISEQTPGDLQTLSSRIYSLLENSQSSGQPLSLNDQQILKEAAETLKLQILSSVMGLKIFEAAQTSLNESSKVQFNQAKNGLLYGIYNEVLILLPPLVASLDDERQLLSDFESILDDIPRRYDWVVDCSGLKVFSGLFFGNLIFYQERLRGNNRNLHFCWLGESLLPERQMHTLTRIFGLVKVGNHFFSDHQSILASK